MRFEPILLVAIALGGCAVDPDPDGTFDCASPDLTGEQIQSCFPELTPDSLLEAQEAASPPTVALPESIRANYRPEDRVVWSGRMVEEVAPPPFSHRELSNP